ncbi:MAG: protoporphyrinogen oxidase, partial [bacterium]|nr:protoporphyrinogen oxidase [bacterium]
MKSVASVGGGISGLSTDYYLAEAGIPSTLIERQPHLGGVITTKIVEGCVVEGGPDSFLTAKPWAMHLIRDLGLEDQVIGSNDHLRVTYVRKKGALVPLPDGLMMMVPTKILPMVTTGLLGWGTKLQMAAEWFRRRDAAPKQDRSVADFVADHYGQEAVDYLAEPLLAGVYGGSPQLLSVGSVLNRFVELEAQYGSLTRGVLSERKKAAAAARGGTLFRTLRGGLGQLVAALQDSVAKSMTVRTGEAEALETDGKGFRIRVNGQWMAADRLVLACQSYHAADLIETVEPEVSELLGSIAYSSSMTVALGYDKSSFRHPLEGFGFLVPKLERGRMIACTWVGTKFTHRVPDDRVMLRCFLGGCDDAAILDEPDETVVATVREELRNIMSIAEEPVFIRVSRWPRSMAQYT